MKSKLEGKVISTKQDKTVVVEVSRVKKHPRYEKRYEVHKKYKAHDENEDCVEGDRVLIEEAKPISRRKRWKVVKKLKKS